MMAMAAVGKQLSEAGSKAAAIDARARALGDMFCAYLESLRAGTTRPANKPRRASAARNARRAVSRDKT